MTHPRKRIDRAFLLATILLVIVGFFIFSSASLGLLARGKVQFSTVAVSQLLFGVGGGMIALATMANIHYRRYRAWAPYLFGAALVLTLLVFVPVLGYEAHGARRWLNVFNHSFQPSELLKITSVLCLAWYYSKYHRRLHDVRYALSGYFALLVLVGVPLLLQPDTGTFIIIAAAGLAMTVAAGVRVRYLLFLAGLLAVGLLTLAVARPYLLDRVMTFVNPSADPTGAGYQIKQSLIAVGSGSWFGRGFGQSVQKFSYLPEPIGDSIFSVAAEEFGFIGSVVIISLFMFFAVRGLAIGARIPDRFGGLVVVGLVILLVTQSFMNIGSMLGLMPLTGEPLTFMSHGGTSLLLALAGVGIVLNISRYRSAH